MARSLVILVLGCVLVACVAADNETSTTPRPATATTVPSTTTTLGDAYPHRDDAVARAEEFLDALYGLDEEAMLATLAPTSPSWGFVTFYQGWMREANFAITTREPCEFQEGGVIGFVTCAITVEDDVVKAVGLDDHQVTDEFTIYFNDEGVTLVEVSGNEPPELTEGFEWVFETYPELRDFEEPCWAMFDGGPTPEACAAAVIAALKEYALQATMNVPPVVVEWAEAMVAGDADAVVALFTETGVWEDQASRTENEGTRAIGQHVSVGLSFADFDEMTPISVTTTDGMIETKWIWSGMSSTVARGPDDKTPFTTEATTVFEMDDDLIARAILDYPYSQLFN